MNILGMLKKAVSPEHKDIERDLIRLNKRQDGLGQKAINYVITGKDETVLATLNTVGGGAQLEVCSRYSYGNEPQQQRRLMLLDRKIDDELCARYIEVLTASLKSVTDEAAGSENMSPAARVWFSEFFMGAENRYHYNRKPDMNTQDMEQFLSVAQHFGATMPDVVEALYANSSSWSTINGEYYRQIVDIWPTLLQEKGAIIEGASRLNANDRVTLLNELSSAGADGDEAFLTFLVDQAGNSSKLVRVAAQSALRDTPAEQIEPLAIERLSTGNASMREGMVALLLRTGSQRAMAALKEHRPNEKTARIKAAIDAALSVPVMDAADEPGDDATGYRGLSGQSIAISELKPLPDVARHRFGDKDREILLEAVKQENIKRTKGNEEAKRTGHRWMHNNLLKNSIVDKTIDLFNGDMAFNNGKVSSVKQFLQWGGGENWARSALLEMPVKQALKLSIEMCDSVQPWIYYGGNGHFAAYLENFLSGEQGDMRHLEVLGIELGVEFTFGSYRFRKTRKLIKGDCLRQALDAESYIEANPYDHFPPNAIWPYLAENINVLDEALGLSAQSEIKLSRIDALELLPHFPEPPQRYFGVLLEIATGEGKRGRALARKLLGGVESVGQRLITLLEDPRQAVRAGAAEWLSERGDEGAVAALRKRLKKEKSEVARAAFLAALDRLGEDLAEFLGPKALKEEAEKGLKKAKFEKLEWMGLEHLPACRFKDNKPVPREVLMWWIFLAFKLKQPGGMALFRFYLSRLDPKDAGTFSTWVLDSWINYDTARPSDSDANAYARENAAQRYNAFKQWYEDYSQERAFADLKREFQSDYLNSGAASKGILALACYASPAVAADRVRNFLKNHGSRLSQSTALLDLLVDIDDPLALQVLIVAATRMKQKSLQEHAGQLVEKVADKHGWTLDELADRTIPTAGFDDEGVLLLPVREGTKTCTAILTSDLKIELKNPDGATIKALPAAKDEETKASKKQLSASKRELKQIVAMQTARLYEALCSERRWPVEDWLRDLHGHPVMRRLIERIVWIGLDDDGKQIAAFRPTAEGDFTTEQDDEVALGEFASIRIAHGTLLSDEEAQGWQQHLEDYEIEALFVQFGRNLLEAGDGMKELTIIEDRKGWVTDAFTLRGFASKLGYERGSVEDAGFFMDYRKSFKSAGIEAIIEFSGNCVPEENVTAALHSLSFSKLEGRRGRSSMKLADVPPVLLSECWNDYHAMAAKAAYDENWEKKMPW